MSTGNAMQTIIGSDVTVPQPVKYGPPKEKQKGLDWAKISPPAEDSTLPPTTAEVRAQQMAQHTEAIERVERLEGRSKRTLAPLKTNTADTSPAVIVAEPAVRRALEDTSDGFGVSVTQVTPEVRAVAATLQQTEGSTDMVVAACRAAVIAAADALRGAALRAQERGRRAKAPVPEAGTVRRSGVPRVEETMPGLLDTIRRLYYDEGRGVETIAAELDMSPNTVSRVMKRNNMKLRTVVESIALIRERINTRLAALGVTEMHVRRWAQEHEIDVAERGMLPEGILDRFEESR